MIGQAQGSTGQARLSAPEVRLLMLASRPALSAAQQSMAAGFVPQVRQWPAFIDTAWRKFSLPMVYQNLACLPDSAPPDDVLATLRSLSLQATSEMLRRRAAFDWFHAHCVLPSGAEHAYFKGPALAARFYPDPTQRFYRDIDILVPVRQRIDLLRRMRDQGCRIYQSFSSGLEVCDLDSDGALAAFLFVTPVPQVVTPQGLLVELHAEIDLHTSLFDTNALMLDAREVTTPHHSIRVLPDTAHIVFICYHHTRHLWSKLNWLADLDVICTHPEFDRAGVLEYACARKIDSTVRASLELHELASAARHPSEFDRATPGVDLLRACVDGLAGDLALEQEMRQGQRMHTLAFDWQEIPLSRGRLAWHRLRNIRPTYDDMQTFRGTGPMRYACAFGVRLARAVRNVLTRTACQ